jgi:hypothetical protein
VIALGHVGLAAPAELPAAEDPFSIFGGWDSGQLLWLAILIPIAVLVFSVGTKRVKSQLGTRGRERSVSDDGYRRDEAWRTAVDRLEAKPPTPIASAQSGLVRIQGVITGATGNLGGAPGRECVWRNRAGAGPKTAVAAELVFLADDSGRCGLEELEQARVVAPVDKVGMHYESTSLYIGDRIEVIGRFERDVLGEDEDPTRLVYGTLGGDARLDVHVRERASVEKDAEVGPKAPETAAGRPAEPAETDAVSAFGEVPTEPDPPTGLEATEPVESPDAPAPR